MLTNCQKNGKIVNKKGQNCITVLYIKWQWQTCASFMAKKQITGLPHCSVLRKWGRGLPLITVLVYIRESMGVQPWTLFLGNRLKYVLASKKPRLFINTDHQWFNEKSVCHASSREVGRAWRCTITGGPGSKLVRPVSCLSLIHIWRCRRYSLCRSRWSPYH